MSSRKILIIEDEPNTAQLLSALLAGEGYQPVTASHGSEGLTATAEHCPDLVLLNLGLPGMDGTEVLRHLREWYDSPVIVLSGRTGEQDKIQALDLGADDYITKPFSNGELLARIRAALRGRQRAEGGPKPSLPASYTVGGLTVDFERHQVTVDGKPVHLTQNEFRIVELLAWKPGQVVPYGYLMERIWGPYVPESNKILRVNMSHIRRKLEADPKAPRYLLTEAGIGYRISAE